MPRMPGVQCASCGNLMWRSSRSLPAGVATCRACRAVAHGTVSGYTYRKCRCDECREAKSNAMRAYVARRKERTGASPWVGRSRDKRTNYSLSCGYCEREFTAPERHQRFCSLECAGMSRRKIPCTDLVHVGPKNRSAPPTPVTTVVSPKWWDVIVYGPCAWCGEAFTSLGRSSRYCTKRCRRHYRESRRGGKFHVPPSVRFAIYERDGWVCQLCFALVDPDADPRSDWYPSLDHIEPQSSALIPDHSESNLRTAHRWCNAVLGDGRWHSDLFALRAS